MVATTGTRTLNRRLGIRMADLSLSIHAVWRLDRQPGSGVNFTPWPAFLKARAPTPGPHPPLASLAAGYERQPAFRTILLPSYLLTPDYNASCAEFCCSGWRPQ